MTTLDRTVKLLKETDGRDKLYKATAMLAKIIAWRAADADVAKKATAVQKSITDARSLMRMAKWIPKYSEAAKESKKIGENKEDSLRAVAKVVRIFADMCYIAGDNIQYLSKFQVLSFDHKMAAKRSKVFQFWGYVVSALIGLYDIRKKLQEGCQLADKAVKELVLNFIADVCDGLSALASVGYIESYQPSAGFTGACGLISAIIACRKNWNKTAPTGKTLKAN
eukprot:Sspe_Gene.64992::Locus_38495_Transcript_1_1_Confidence_1.000_Length_778::g.64992::m.64992